MTRREEAGQTSTTSRTVEDPRPGPGAERLREIPVFQPDNSCCFCLSLKSGTAIISILHSLFYLGLIIWSVKTLNIKPKSIKMFHNFSSNSLFVPNNI